MKLNFFLVLVLLTRNCMPGENNQTNILLLVSAITLGAGWQLTQKYDDFKKKIEKQRSIYLPIGLGLFVVGLLGEVDKENFISKSFNLKPIGNFIFAGCLGAPILGTCFSSFYNKT